MIPMGVASMSFTWADALRLQAADVLRQLLPADGCLQARASGSPGSAWSFPEPDTPVTTVSLPFGNVHLQGLHRMDGAGGQVDAALRANSCCRQAACGPEILRCARQKGADAGSRICCQLCALVPCAITRPPPAPASGPISMSQSAWERIWVSWSTSMHRIAVGHQVVA